MEETEAEEVFQEDRDNLDEVYGKRLMPEWAASAVIYEVNVRQYTEEGTFQTFGQTEKMGVNTLWFMPIYPISQKNRVGSLGSYYFIADCKAVNPEFGTIEDFVSPPEMGWNDVARLNYENADMRSAMIDAMKYWVTEADIDGFRCDYAGGVPRDFWERAGGELNFLDC